MSSLTKDKFFKDVASHELVILRDDGVYRHLRFTRHNTRCMQFDFITWPGYLCYTGDMGTFVFERSKDMLAFFRPSEQNKEDPFKWIDFRYWHEKIESLDKGGAKEFDPDDFRREITKQRRRILVEHGRDIDHNQRLELWDELGDLKDKAEDGEERAMAAAYEWSFDLNRSTSQKRRLSIGLDVDDFPDCKCWTHRFMWCCFALRWGVMAYDKAKQAQAGAVAAEGGAA